MALPRESLVDGVPNTILGTMMYKAGPGRNASELHLDSPSVYHHDYSPSRKGAEDGVRAMAMQADDDFEDGPMILLVEASPVAPPDVESDTERDDASSGTTCDSAEVSKAGTADVAVSSCRRRAESCQVEWTDAVPPARGDDHGVDAVVEGIFSLP